MFSSVVSSSERNGRYRSSIMEYVNNTSMMHDNSLKFQEDLETTDPLFEFFINVDKELKDYFGARVPNILNGAHYKVTSTVGSGAQGKVVLARNMTDRKLYVIKMSNEFSNSNVVHHFLREYMFQEHAHHVLKGRCSVPKPKGIIRMKQGDSLNYMIVSEFCSVIPDVASALSINQALKEHLNHRSILSLTEWKDVCISLIDAVHTLQSNDIYHIDLKTDNILLQFIDDKVKPVIIDFGISVRKNTHKGAFGFLFAPGPDTDRMYPQIDPVLFETLTPLPTTDLYGISHVINQLSWILQLPTLRHMIQRYRRQTPAERKPYAVVLAATKTCFDQDIEKQIPKKEKKCVIQPKPAMRFANEAIVNIGLRQETPNKKKGKANGENSQIINQEITVDLDDVDIRQRQVSQDKAAMERCDVQPQSITLQTQTSRVFTFVFLSALVVMAVCYYASC